MNRIIILFIAIVLIAMGIYVGYKLDSDPSFGNYRIYDKESQDDR